MIALTTRGALDRYFEVMREYPQLFRPAVGNNCLRIITDRWALIAAQDKLKKKAKSRGMPRHFYTLGVVCEDEWYMTIRDLVRFPDGKEGPYVRFVCKKGVLQGVRNVVIIPYWQRRVLVTRQFRHERRDWVWETPRGFGTPGLDALANCRKELFEETGLTASRTHLLFRAHVDDASIIVAEVDGTQVLRNSDGKEGIAEMRWLTLSELEKWILDGSITDAALMAAFIYLEKLPEKWFGA